MFERGRHIVLVHVLFLVSLFICVNGGHFVLIHGASYGAWCWYKVASHLKSAGHIVTALDLGASGINPKQAREIRTFSQYNEPLITYMGSLPPEEKVILVAHSFGGIPVSVAMEKFPDKISVAVFVSAAVLSENYTASEAPVQNNTMDTQIFFDDGFDKPPTAILYGPKYMATMMYQLSPYEDLTLALSLVRPHPLFSDINLFLNETRVTKERNGRVAKVYIACKSDKLVPESSVKETIEKTGPFKEVKAIRGADHMAMFSQPRRLSSHLLEIARKFHSPVWTY